MTLYLNNLHPRRRISRNYFEKKSVKILRHLKLPQAILGITFVSDPMIARLNASYLGKKGPTDVLSFPMGGYPLLGDIVISLDTADKQAKQLQKSLQTHCMFLIIHGLLHLLGYDHVRRKDWIRMQKKEAELLKRMQGS